MKLTNKQKGILMMIPLVIFALYGFITEPFIIDIIYIINTVSMVSIVVLFSIGVMLYVIGD